MDLKTKYYIYLFITVAVYFIISKVIFDKVNDTIHTIVDEYHHIPQGILYCNGNFSHWNPMITTLPGLYLVSTIVGTYFECNTYNLRFINLIASCINLILFANIMKYVYYNEKSQAKIILQALSLSLLPPLYFFSHVYYTDTLSLTFLLIFSRLCFTNKHKILILLFGIFSIMMRQTNVAWIAMVFGHKFLDIFIKSSRVFGNQYITDVKLSKRSLIAKDVDSSKLKRYYGLTDLYYAINYHLKTYLSTFFRFLTVQDMSILIVHLIILSVFVSFVFINGSIVVGDKTAHEPTIHTPQLLYFLIFYGIFGIPYVLSKFTTTLKLILKKKLLTVTIALIFTAMVHFHTTVHPYLIADNRHYTFYVWIRWFGKYDYAIYATIPAYVFLVFSLYDNLREHNCISFLFPYTLSLILVLALQKLIEVRYFLIPYIVLRLRFGRPSQSVILAELFWYICLNSATFYIFFTKELYWSEFDYAQRIIW